ncbi:Heterokaryon incompatibility protein 6, OR allele [Madurella mycetomatis]|uniref:Heterokaryon incompatibility protein 6, OR allele n=1 Tax=Madurella mycetomatis TaxID=100816 RepID=A0A175WGC6_9PEZI|nr:Heterokaryon incompatibility protein 6, OR allele [Madurella mycetomatis]
MAQGGLTLEIRVQLDQATRDLPFVYGTLAARHIRLLRQVPSTSDGVPHLLIETYPLDQAPKFSALSYTWGSPTLGKVILCNGRRKHITENLYYALGRAFSWRDDIYLWADGLCINQEDILERNQQVRLMGEIYTLAERTVAYIGEPLHDDTAEGAAADMDEVPLALMQCLSRILEKGAPDRPDQRSNEDWEMLHMPGMDSDGMVSDSLRKWFSVLALCWQPWFTRAWVLQEVALAKDVMVFYGSATNTLECLTQFWALSTRRDLPPALRYGSIADYKGLIDNTSLLSIFTELRAAKAQELVCNDRPPGPNFVLPGRHSQSRTLLRLLKNTRRAAATDSRDKVYCLMSLATDISSLELAPDYSTENTTALVYRHVAEAYIQSGYAIDVLYQAGLPRSAHVDGLPSWVPDWSAQARRPLDERRYCCMKDTVPTSDYPGP